MTAVRPTDVRAAGALAGKGLAAGTTLIRDTHVAIARRAFTLSGPVARPVHAVHDAISQTVYATVGGSLALAGRATGVLASTRSRGGARGSARRLADLRRGNVVVGAVNGAWGDRLSSWSHPLALTMSLRHEDRDLVVRRD